MKDSLKQKNREQQFTVFDLSQRRLELPRPCGHQPLKLARLPFRHCDVV
jgi:hypothetical protein